MLSFLIILLIILYLTGFISIPSLSFLHRTLFYLNGRAVSVWDILILSVILYLLGFLQGPLRGIATILLILWILSVLGIIAISGFANLILALLLVGLILHLLGISF
ncbi:hypothetical protein A2W14_03170 [Candidatus Gottesmanbacteria bacterium RBG_16_37_8]|uniref:Uncharacterized protein n=1 Tax=Candidatus Gottesmanbacteria bacterium RBG_16_37_8 TaxID=1798371 RepID=A0A1F5YTM3_9BACT|nr:MAG: hypothetical protein A2W14_03170 [Candidatus Gottesmanbacteria bacterium RBG_16_37_8]